MLVIKTNASELETCLSFQLCSTPSLPSIYDLTRLKVVFPLNKVY